MERGGERVRPGRGRGRGQPWRGTGAAGCPAPPYVAAARRQLPAFTETDGPGRAAPRQPRPFANRQPREAGAGLTSPSRGNGGTPREGGRPCQQGRQPLKGRRPPRRYPQNRVREVQECAYLPADLRGVFPHPPSPPTSRAGVLSARPPPAFISSKSVTFRPAHRLWSRLAFKYLRVVLSSLHRSPTCTEVQQ